MQPNLEVTYLQMTLIGIGVGFVLGLIPLILGMVKKKMKLGILGFVCSIAGGAIWSLISLIIVIVFVVVIFKKTPPTEDPGSNDLPGDTDLN